MSKDRTNEAFYVLKQHNWDVNAASNEFAECAQPPAVCDARGRRLLLCRPLGASDAAAPSRPRSPIPDRREEEGEEEEGASGGAACSASSAAEYRRWQLNNRPSQSDEHAEPSRNDGGFQHERRGGRGPGGGRGRGPPGDFPRNRQHRQSGPSRRLTPPPPSQGPTQAAAVFRLRAGLPRRASSGLGLSRPPPLGSRSPLTGSTLSGTSRLRARPPGELLGPRRASGRLSLHFAAKKRASDRPPARPRAATEPRTCSSSTRTAMRTRRRSLRRRPSP